MVPMSRRGRPLLSWQLGCSVPTGGQSVLVNAQGMEPWGKNDTKTPTQA